MNHDRPTPSRQKLKVVLLEDDAGCQMFIQNLLSEMAGDFEFITFTNGDEAWAGLQSLQPDLLITDHIHHGMSGWELIERLSESKPSFPIIFMTAYSTAPNNLPQLVQRGIKVIYSAKPDLLRLPYHLNRWFPGHIQNLAYPAAQAAVIVLTPQEVLGLHGRLLHQVHKFRNICTVLTGYLRLLKGSTNPDHQRRAADTLAEQPAIVRAWAEEIQGWHIDACVAALTNNIGSDFEQAPMSDEKLPPHLHLRQDVEVPAAALADLFRRMADWAGDLCDDMDWLAVRFRADDLATLKTLATGLVAEMEAKCRSRLRRHNELYAELNRICGILPEAKPAAADLAGRDGGSRAEEPASKPAPASADPAQMEKALLAQLNDSTQDHRPVLWKLAVIYNRTQRPEPAMDCLRRLLALEPDLEKKAACILALGQSMEQLGDWSGAIRFYGEALALEPMSNSTWYFIHNNLGYCHNQLGDFAAGEQRCRAAITINPVRPNAYKNLGFALAGQGDYRQAAHWYVTGTLNFAGDPRSFHLLKQLLAEHPQLDFEFGEPCARCERHVGFAQAARERAMAGQPYRVLLGLENSPWADQCGQVLFALGGGNLQVAGAKSLSEFLNLGEQGAFHLAIAAPGTLPTGYFSGNDGAAGWRAFATAVRQLREKQPLPVLAVGTATEVAGHAASLREAGAAELLEMNGHFFPLMDAVMQHLGEKLET
jgi:CheY-like chemotaxis protein/Tfp pilus assembly protein PilF